MYIILEGFCTPQPDSTCLTYCSVNNTQGVHVGLSVSVAMQIYTRTRLDQLKISIAHFTRTALYILAWWASEKRSVPKFQIRATRNHSSKREWTFKPCSSLWPYVLVGQDNIIWQHSKSKKKNIIVEWWPHVAIHRIRLESPMSHKQHKRPESSNCSSVTHKVQVCGTDHGSVYPGPWWAESRKESKSMEH